MNKELENEMAKENELFKHNISIFYDDKKYFIKKNVEEVTIFFFYIENKNFEVFNKVVIDINNSTLKKDQLYKLILENKKESNKKYKPRGIYKYNLHNLNIQTIDIYNLNCATFEQISTLDDIYFEDTIHDFEDYASLFILFEKNETSKTCKHISKANKKTLKNN